MPCQESLILDYSVPCAAIAVVCLVSNSALQKEWGGQGVPLWRGIWAKEYHDSSCHCPPCTNTLCPTLSAIFPVLAAT